MLSHSEWRLQPSVRRSVLVLSMMLASRPLKSCLRQSGRLLTHDEHGTIRRLRCWAAANGKKS